MKKKGIAVGVGVSLVAALLFLDRRATHHEVDQLRDAVKKAETVAARTPVSTSARSWASASAVSTRPELDDRPVRVDGTPPASGPKAGAAAPSTRTERGRPGPAASRTESFAAIHDTMEAAFVGETMDTSWARGAHKTAESSLSRHLPDGSRITSIECRSTMCRVESTHSHGRAADRFVNDALGEPDRTPWNGSFATGAIAEAEANGSVTMVTYLMREGNELPEVDADLP